MQFVEIDAKGETHNAGPAPFLDYEPLKEELRPLIEAQVAASGWLREDLEPGILNYAIQNMVPDHIARVKDRRIQQIDRTAAAVKDRLTKEIVFWDHRAEELKAQEQAGRVNARLNSEMARRRADDLQARLQRRLEELEAGRRISPQPPLVIGGALVIPAGLLSRLTGQTSPIDPGLFGLAGRKAVEDAAMDAVLLRESNLGCEPDDVHRHNLGWDIESRIPGTGRLRFIEVKGRVTGTTTVTVSKNEILAGLNKPDDYILALVEVEFMDGKAAAKNVHYIQRPFQREPDFAATSVNYDIKELLR
jgi:hypothetical protein